MKFVFPIGYHELHKEPIINFQLNRWISLGVGRLNDIIEIAPRITGFDDWKQEFISIAEIAESEGRLLNAAFYYRAAEFFVSINDPDKDLLYDKFIELFYSSMKEEPIEQFSIPYENGQLNALRIQVKDSRGLIVAHGGFDSFIEELYPILAFFAENGYEVIMFDGPGQGASLKKYGLTLTPYWEKPVKAVLDYFGISNATLLGISLGGYLALRAAAYEPRIQKVIAYDVVYDWTKCVFARYGNHLKRALVGLLLKHAKPKTINRRIEKRMKESLHYRWGYEHGMFATGTSSPYDYIRHLQLYSAVEISHLVKQDVLLMAGEKDHAVPVEMFHKQMKALKNASSITGRIFTEKENASGHCQVGNLQLALGYILKWLEGKPM